MERPSGGCIPMPIRARMAAPPTPTSLSGLTGDSRRSCTASPADWAPSAGCFRQPPRQLHCPNDGQHTVAKGVRRSLRPPPAHRPGVSRDSRPAECAPSHGGSGRPAPLRRSAPPCHGQYPLPRSVLLDPVSTPCPGSAPLEPVSTLYAVQHSLAPIRPELVSADGPRIGPRGRTGSSLGRTGGTTGADSG